MITPLSGLFSLRKQEVGPASLLFSYLFLIIGAYLMGQAVGDALFLAAFPKHLPVAMIGTAPVIGALVAVYIRLSARLRLRSLIIGMLLFFAFSFVAFWCLTRVHLLWVYWLVYLWVYAMGAMGPMMGWTLANFLLTAREAKRVFGFIGAGAILGGTFVSFITSDVLRRGGLKPQSLLLGVALILAICALLVVLIFRNSRHRLGSLGSAPIMGQETPQGFSQSLKVIRCSHYLLLLTGLVVIGCLATSILGYQFRLIAKTSFGADTAALAAFFSRFYGYMGLASLVFQLLVTGPLLRAFGIRVTLFVVPIALMGGTIGVLLAPTLLAGSILRGSHSLLRYSIDKSSTELLYLPVSPEVKSQVKSFIDTFIWRSADGLAGLTLLFFANALSFSPQEISSVNLVVLAAWIAIAYGVRREYVNVLRQAIERRTLDPGRTAAQVLDLSTIEVLGQALEHGSEQQLLYGMSLFEMSGQPGWHPVLRQLLEHRSPTVRLSALRLLNHAGDPAILLQAEKLLVDENLEVRAEALHYLVVHAGRDPLSLLGEEHDFPPHVLQGAIVAYLACNGESDYSQATGLILRSMLEGSGPDAVLARREAARTLGAISPPSVLHDRLQELLSDEDAEVVEQALLSAGRIRLIALLPAVIAKLGEARASAAARAALIMYGESAIGALRSDLNDPGVALTIRKRIAQTLARIPTADSADALARSLVQSDPGLRYDVLKALNQLRERDPALLPADVDYTDMLNAELMGYLRSLQVMAAYDSPWKPHGAELSRGGERLLKRAFLEQMDHELERIFRLLALVYPPRDIHNAFVGLISARPQLQANALEMLEQLLQPELYRRLANVLDPEIDPGQRLDFARQVCRADVSSKVEALRVLLYSEDSWIRACALYAVGSLQLEELAPEIDTMPCSGDALLVETRNWTTQRLVPRATA